MLFDYLASKDKGLEHTLEVARIDLAGSEYLKRSFQKGMLFAAAFSGLLFIFMQDFGTSVLSFLISLPVLYMLFKNEVRLKIRQREQRIDRDLLFAGQYMLVKLESGLPLFNTLIHAARENNETGRFFREIVQDINTGSPIEQALAKGRDTCPSENMRKVLGEIVTSLKTGADVTQVMKNSLRDISRELLLEVKAYNKKLNSIMMFYMIVGTVIPSIGISLFIILLSFLGIVLNAQLLIIVIFLLVMMQFLFVGIINSARPTVNL